MTAAAVADCEAVWTAHLRPLHVEARRAQQIAQTKAELAATGKYAL